MQQTCEGCDGQGVRCPAEPSCRIDGVDLSMWTIVERCDVCETFADDAQAARQIYCTVRWVQCADDGWHAIGCHPRA
jgi:hypothetical protein